MKKILRSDLACPWCSVPLGNLVARNNQELESGDYTVCCHCHRALQFTQIVCDGDLCWQTINIDPCDLTPQEALSICNLVVESAVKWAKKLVADCVEGSMLNRITGALEED